METLKRYIWRSEEDQWSEIPSPTMYKVEVFKNVDGYFYYILDRKLIYPADRAAVKSVLGHPFRYFLILEEELDKISSWWVNPKTPGGKWVEGWKKDIQTIRPTHRIKLNITWREDKIKQL